MYAWALGFSSGGSTTFVFQKTQFDVIEPTHPDIIFADLKYIATDNDIVDYYLRDNSDGTYTWVFIDIFGNEYDGQEANYVGISANYDELTGYLTITRSGSIPIVVERYSSELGGFQTLATFSAGTSDISFFLPAAGRYRIRRDWTNELECSNVVYIEVSKIVKLDTQEGEKLLVGRYGQLQVGKMPDDPDYNANYDKTYMIFGLVRLPFTVSGSAGATSLTVVPDTSEYNTPNLLSYLKYDGNNTNYLNLIKLKNDVYFAKPTSPTTLELETGLKETITDERLYAVNQFKIFSDIYLASGLNKIVFEDSQMTLEDWGGTVAFIRYISPDTSLQVMIESGTTYDSDISVHINKVSGGVTAGRIKIGVSDSHDPYILFSKTGTGYYTLVFKDNGTVSYLEAPNGLKLAARQTTSASYPDGTLLVDSATGNLKFKKGGIWYNVQLT
jgi:hypothetical protein